MNEDPILKEVTDKSEDLKEKFTETVKDEELREKVREGAERFVDEIQWGTLLVGFLIGNRFGRTRLIKELKKVTKATSW